MTRGVVPLNAGCGWGYLILLISTALCLQAAALFHAGVGKTDITPPVGTPLNGYGDRLGRPSVAIHDPLFARAVYLDDGSTQAVIVSTDLCMIHRELRDRVMAFVPQEIPANAVFLTATHTHNAQGAMHQNLPWRFVSGRFNPEVLERTAKAIAEAIRQAYDSRRPATIGYAVGEQHHLSANRRIPGGPIDPQIGVILIREADGAPMAVITNFAAHPTSVPESDRFVISADYLATYYETVEQSFAPETLALFLNGAEGNQTLAPMQGSEGWALTERAGKALALAAKEIAANIICRELPIYMAERECTLPPTAWPQFLPTQATLRTLEIGDALLAFFPGEPVVEIGLALREQALARGYAACFAVGLADEYLGYFVTPELYATDAYESSMNFYGPFIASWFYREFHALMRRGTPPSEPQGGAEISEPTPTDGILLIEKNPARIGARLGGMHADAVLQAVENKALMPIREHKRTPSGNLWTWVPPFIDPSLFVLRDLSLEARHALAELDPEDWQELEGFAQALARPFEPLLLTMHTAADTPSAGAESSPLRLPMTWAVTQSGKTPQAWLAQVLPRSAVSHVIVYAGKAQRGSPFACLTSIYPLGAYAGFNTRGVSVALDLSEAKESVPLHQAPPSWYIKRALRRADDVTALVTWFKSIPLPHGCRVVIGSNTGGAPVWHVLRWENGGVTVDTGNVYPRDIAPGGGKNGPLSGTDEGSASAHPAQSSLDNAAQPPKTLEEWQEFLLRICQPLEQPVSAYVWDSASSRLSFCEDSRAPTWVSLDLSAVQGDE